MKVSFAAVAISFVTILPISKQDSQEVAIPDSDSSSVRQLESRPSVASSPTKQVVNVIPKEIQLRSNTTLVDIFSAILTPLVAVFLAYIALQQLRTNKEKLKLDKFDKRFEIYEATKKYLSKISADGDVKSDDLADFGIETSKSYFLFGNDIEEYLRELYSRGVDLNYTQKKLRSDRMSQAVRNEVIEKDHEAFTWLTGQLLESKNIFGKYMRFEK